MAFHDTLEEGNGPLIFLFKTSDSLCPTDNTDFGFYNVLTEEVELEADPYMVSWASDEVAPTECSEIEVSGTVAQHYEHDCTFIRHPLQYNNYPVFEVCLH